MMEQPDVTAAAAPQLAQVKVPLREAGGVLAVTDPTGRTPIVVVVESPSRVNVGALALSGLIVVFGIVGGLLLSNGLLLIAGVLIGIVCGAATFMQAFFVQIPEGANGLLVRRGAHAGVVGPGSHVIPPWVAISHLVTRREIPYDPPIAEAPTRDNVRAWVDSLITFSIAEPYRFVYTITATDFDAILAAACQDSLRRMIRTMTWDQIGDLTRAETDDLRAALGAEVEAYGVTIPHVTITFARPPIDFLLSQEARHLAVLQRDERAEQHALELRRQSDEDEIAHQRALARVARERDELQIRIQEAESKQRVAELEADAVISRLAKLEEALERFPHAARWEFEGAQLEAVRAIATNNRAFVQLGNTDEMGRALVIRDILQGALGETPPNGDTKVPEGQPGPAKQ